VPDRQTGNLGARVAAGDVGVIEASSNTFVAAQRLHAAGVKPVVLESQRAGQICARCPSRPRKMRST